MFAVSGQAIDAGPNNKMGLQLAGFAEQLVNIALTIADMNASTGLAEKSARMA